MIEFLDPRGVSSTKDEPYNLSLDITENQGAGVRVALLANGFPDSELFMRKLGTALETCLPNVRTHVWSKVNPGVAASNDILDEIIDQCHVAVSAIGH